MLERQVQILAQAFVVGVIVQCAQRHEILVRIGGAAVDRLRAEAGGVAQLGVFAGQGFVDRGGDLFRRGRGGGPGG